MLKYTEQEHQLLKAFWELKPSASRTNALKKFRKEQTDAGAPKILVNDLDFILACYKSKGVK